jgi:hypothetical protein
MPNVVGNLLADLLLSYTESTAAGLGAKTEDRIALANYVTLFMADYVRAALEEPPRIYAVVKPEPVGRA